MKVFRDPKKLQKWTSQLARLGKRVALIPTMGALHEGHLSLIETAKKKGADEIVVSVFVNPVQFGPNEDFEKYPRDEKADLAKCRKAGATAIFFPTPENMYLPRHSVYVNEEDLSKGLCGARRPGHFRGVCTVVAKLFNLVKPEFAVFGQKDYQQAQIIKRMERDLNFGIEIVVAPIIREPSGLARSSRNAYLSEEEKAKALTLSKSLFSVKIGKSASSEIRRIKNMLTRAGLVVDYVECVDGETLTPVKTLKKGDTVLLAVFDGKTRLIDNMTLA